jgi:hypothetical protein
MPSVKNGAILWAEFAKMVGSRSAFPIICQFTKIRHIIVDLFKSKSNDVFKDIASELEVTKKKLRVAISVSFRFCFSSMKHVLTVAFIERV